ncbi:Cro/Cl family transcriptional regulator [Lapidilactobacillus concavus]|nr:MULTISPECIES: XRE family transcriptional regulator [Lapidilactobacillus]GEL14047.1 Cro/Cl family transcriptional regulator [Lapidilactobacillus concavus]
MRELENIPLNQALKTYRKRNRLSQQALADILNIERSTLSRYEKGTRLPTGEVLKKITQFMPWLINHGNPLDSIFDYIKVRFNNLQPDEVIKKILNLRPKFFVAEEYGMPFYPQILSYGSIRVLSDPNKASQGVIIELTGQGCREYEQVFGEDGLEWTSFFAVCLHNNGVFKRIDIAINDYLPILNIPDVIKRVKQGNFSSQFKKYSGNFSGFTPSDDNDDIAYTAGETIYFGTPKSNLRIVFYEKDQEQANKYNQLPEDEAIKNRYEVRFKNDYAEDIAVKFLECADNMWLVLGVIDHYLTLLDRPKQTNIPRSEWQASQDWLDLLNDAEEVKLVLKPREYNYQRSFNALTHQFSSTIATTREADKATGTVLLDTLVNKSEMKPRQKKMLAAMLATRDEVIEDKDWHVKEN